MRRNAIHLSARFQRWFYTVFAVLFVSGVVWFVLDRVHQGDDEPHPAGPWLLRLHGAAAMVALVLLGALLPLHVRYAWKARRNRLTGVVILSACGALILTGYALYYVGGENAHRLAVVSHDALGLALPLVITWHALTGRRSAQPTPAETK